MSHGGPPTDPTAEASLKLSEGWHCSHFYYRFRRDVLQSMDSGLIDEGKAKFVEILDKQADRSPAKLQTSVVSGHKADFGLMIMDPDPLLVEGVHQQLMAGPLGPALDATYSFVSVTEVSEYVPTIEQYAQRLLDDGETQDSPAFQAKVRAYEKREPMMRRQRLTPDLPLWPATCFYPMNKKRKVGENWFLLPFSGRNSMMAEHARSGMAFAGKVSQLITVAVGLDDWEWGVTLWAKNPEFLKDIVYRMRFDEASARYAEFGPFYTSYVVEAQEVLDHCRVGT
jgi:chlorite dismutase